MKMIKLVSLVILLALMSICGIVLLQSPVLVLEICFILLGAAIIGFVCGLLSQTFRRRA